MGCFRSAGISQEGIKQPESGTEKTLSARFSFFSLSSGSPVRVHQGRATLVGVENWDVQAQIRPLGCPYFYKCFYGSQNSEKDDISEKLAALSRFN